MRGEVAADADDLSRNHRRQSYRAREVDTSAKLPPGWSPLEGIGVKKADLRAIVDGVETLGSDAN